MMLKLLSLLVLLSYANGQIWNQATVFANTATLAPNVNLQWNLTATDIFFKLTVATHGWLGFGLSPNGRMANSDIALAWSNPSTGLLQFADCNSRQYNVFPDTRQDWQGLFFNRANGFTTVIFTRKLVIVPAPGQPVEENDINVGATNFVIWAYGNNYGM